ncbi:hypothetical protein ACLOJK_014896 [Asimina triloba]
MVSEDGISVDPHKIKAVVNWPRPTNVTKANKSPDGRGQDPEGCSGNCTRKNRNVMGVVRSVVLSGSDQT